MSKGIYAYYDLKNKKIIYIGKDSHLDKKLRHQQHYQKNRYQSQKINQILQNNLSRYEYQILWETEDCTINHLNQMEIYYINKYNPDFNFTNGGDGISGENHPMYQQGYKIQGKNNPNYKKYARVTLGGHNRYGKQRYCLYFDLKRIGTSIDESFLKKIAQQLNDNKISILEAKKKIKNHGICQKDKHGLYKKDARINKYGKTGYALRYHTINIGYSNDKDFLEKLATNLNDNIITVEEAKNQIKNHKNKTGIQYVFKTKNKHNSRGYVWVYRYKTKNNIKQLSSVSLSKLKQKVIHQGLIWNVIDEQKAQEAFKTDLEVV